ncbi:MAG5620 family putative phospho-sugar mutase [Mycoplasmopsis canis]|uniref:MAG5620 family putative phospho-sugar mutase n=1 Tax=Mycoplasmopsis canis TaxID=29555 RepID=UPI001F45EE60|nr:hypothetical protein [Mycoplasmopsis canis]
MKGFLMNIETLKIWFSFYKNESIFSGSFEEFVTNVKKTFVETVIENNKISPSIYGIKFKGDNMYNFNHLNPFTAISLLNSFLKNSGLTKNSKILIGSDFDSVQINQIKEYFSRFLNRYKIETYVHNSTIINDFLFFESIKASGIHNGIFVSYDKDSQEFYIKFYNKKNEISIEEQRKIISDFQYIKNPIILSKSSQSTVVNLDKVIQNYSDKFLKPYLSRLETLSKKPTFNVYTIISDPQAEYILSKLLAKSGFKVHRINSAYNKNAYFEKFNFKFMKSLSLNYQRADMLIIISSAHEIKIYVWTKNKYILLTEDQLIYLFINNYYLTWKKSGILEKNKLFIPFYTSKNILKLLSTFKIPFDWNKNISRNQNILLSFTDNKFSSNIDNNLNYVNYPFIIKLCFMLYNYKINNNLFDYKYKKMIESNSNILLTSNDIKISYKNSLEILNFYHIGERIYKKIKILEINKVDNVSREQHDYLTIKFSFKKKTFYSYIFYNFKKNSIVFKNELELDNSLNKIKIYLINFIFKRISRKIVRYSKQLKKVGSDEK